MRCPKCNADNDQVVDTRANQEGSVIRRRRRCITCGFRYTTYERFERHLPRVVKRDGRTEAFDREKLARGLTIACQKRPIPGNAIDRLIDDVMDDVEALNAAEVASAKIGTLVMERLRALDPVAYVRFASVYSAFDELSQFIDLIRAITPAPAPKRKPRRA